MRRSRSTFRLIGLLLAVAGSIGVAGCGIGPGLPRQSPPLAATSYQVISVGRPVGPPPNREGIVAASHRITATVDSGDCNRIGALYTLDSPSRESKESCSVLITLTRSATVSGVRSYGDAVGVIEYKAPGQAVSLVLVRQEDGLLHIAFPVAHRAPTTVGTPLGKDADAIAARLVESVRAGSCDRVLSVADHSAGFGSLPRGQACEVLQNDPLQAAVFSAPDARPQRLGGNGQFAFYALDTPSFYLTTVLARSAGGEQPGALGPYGYVASFVSNTPTAASAGQPR